MKIVSNKKAEKPCCEVPSEDRGLSDTGIATEVNRPKKDFRSFFGRFGVGPLLVRAKHV
jgi:hypothetical protein